MGYRLEGDLLEVCNCEVLCPCWIGEDPDHGSCDSALAYRINSGEIGGIDVGGVVMASVVRIPGNVFAGGWRRQLYVDRGASDGQAAAVVAAMTGELGGPMADLAALVGEELPPQRAEVVFDLHEGRGRFAIAGITGRPGLVQGIGLVVALAGYLVMALFPLSEALKPWAVISPWEWALGGDPLLNPAEPWRYATLLLPAVALAALGVTGFVRRDVRAG